MDDQFSFEWDVEAIARAFGVRIEDIEGYLKDGRRVSFLIERRLAHENAGWTLAPSEGASFDLKDPDGDKWEVRSITAGGTYFTPSNQVGKGRRFDEAAFLRKIEEIEGFILSDLMVFPRVDFYKIRKDIILRWYHENKIGKNASPSRKAILRLLKSL